MIVVRPSTRQYASWLSDDSRDPRSARVTEKLPGLTMRSANCRPWRLCGLPRAAFECSTPRSGAAIRPRAPFTQDQ